jgi:hypothetical protein
MNSLECVGRILCFKNCFDMLDLIHYICLEKTKFNFTST